MSTYKRFLSFFMSFVLMCSLLGQDIPVYAENLDTSVGASEVSKVSEGSDSYVKTEMLDLQSSSDGDNNPVQDDEAIELEDDTTPVGDEVGNDVTSNKKGNGSEEQKSEEQKSEEQKSEEQKSEDQKDLDVSKVFSDDCIRISNFSQLSAIGTNVVVTDTDYDEGLFGQGTSVVFDDGTSLTYALDEKYFLEQDIEFPDGKTWSIPEGFSGVFLGPDTSDHTRIFDADTDTIFLQNVYQLDILLSENRAEMPVMTGDVEAETFGSGKFAYETEDGSYITYDDLHHYVLSASFDAERKPLSTLVEAAEAKSVSRSVRSAVYDPFVAGRDYFGQVTLDLTVDGSTTTYILVGDRQQLDAINNASTTHVTHVCKPVYKVEQTRSSALVGWDVAGNIVSESVELVYPGDADLIDSVDVNGTSVDFSGSKLYDCASVGHGLIGSYDYHDLEEDGALTRTRTIWCTIDETTGEYDISRHSSLSHDERVGSLTYTKDGNYIVFRDIDMTKGDADQVEYGSVSDGDWRPLMFTGRMYGVNIANADFTSISDAMADVLGSMASVDSYRPSIYDFNVVPDMNSNGELNIQTQVGVGFFGTITGKFNDSAILTTESVVNNLCLSNGVVENPAGSAYVPGTLLSDVLTIVGSALGLTVGGLLDLLTGNWSTWGNSQSLSTMLGDLLNARAESPDSLATGSFAGRIIGKAQVVNCVTDNVSVGAVATDFEQDSKIVGMGGFVGHVEGETEYEGLSGLLGGLVSVLSGLLNVIPGIGLGDIVTVLLGNALDVSSLIPVAYTAPVISDCSVVNGSLSYLDGQGDSKIGVGGFVGSSVGTAITGCSVRDSSLFVEAEKFGGGFAGIDRDAVIVTTLDGLKVDVLSALHPQSELIGCAIENSSVSVSGGSCLGGFVGAQANSYAIDDTIDGSSSVDVSATGDFAGGFTGRGQLGTALTLGDHINTDADLLGTVTGLLTGLVGAGSDQALLDVAGVAPSGILGCEVLGSVEVSTDGSYAGGLVGRGDGMIIATSEDADIRLLAKYDDVNSSGSYTKSLPSGLFGRSNVVNCLVSVEAGDSFAGGIAGYMTSANTAGLIDGAVGIGQYLGFVVKDTVVNGVDDTQGAIVQAINNYAGGGLGWAVGGDVIDTAVTQLGLVESGNYAGGFVGATGPGDLVNGDGLDVRLLGLSLIQVDGLLSLASGVRTTYTRSNVSGISSGLVVTETGSRSGNDLSDYIAGGWTGEANSVRVVDCHTLNLGHVEANMSEGKAGGFVGDSSTGGLAGVAEDDGSVANLLSLSDVLGAVPYLVPSYDGCSVSYVDGGFVKGDIAGGFAADFRSGKINEYVNAVSGNSQGVNPITDQLYENEHTGGYSCGDSSEPWSVYNISYVRGGRYAGGWGGRVWSGALVDVGGGLSLLGTDGLSLNGLLSVANAYVPFVNYAGVYSVDGGFSVFAAHGDVVGEPASEGMAGGFIGYASGAQVSHCDVNRLRQGEPLEPDALTGDDQAAYSRISLMPDVLESGDGGNYVVFSVFDEDPSAFPYAVAGVTHSGGYIGQMDIGSAASLGDGLSLLDVLGVDDVLSALNVVVSTVEHSDVVMVPGGYSVIASSHINLGDGSFDDVGVGYAGGYVGQLDGGHIQDGNAYNFGYVIGEIAAGGYVGEMRPGDLADVLDDGSVGLLGSGSVLDATNLLSVGQLVVPTIRNSETTCVPCGGVVRADSFSDGTASGGSMLRGVAGGYVGHCVGGQIWGMSEDVWKDSGAYVGDVAYGDGPRECAAVRIRSVYGREYAGGYCGFMECGSTASTGGLSLLGGLLNTSNLLGALRAVYPTIKAGTVYGPLYDVDATTWDAWRQYVGNYGGFASELVDMSFADASDLEYGTHVVAGRHVYDGWSTTALAGCAGGFVGAMHGGAISGSDFGGTEEYEYPSFAYGTKLVLGMRASGGFAGDMQTKGLAEFGSASLFGSSVPLNVGNLLDVGQTFVPAISESGVTGYQQGLRVGATGVDGQLALTSGVGCAGGYVGGCYGGQLGLDNDGASATDGVWVHDLVAVRGTCDVGGFVGRADSASVVNADTNSLSDGVIQDALNSIVSAPDGLLDVLDATVVTIRHAGVTSVDDAWGIVVDGEYHASDGSVQYAHAAGGFAGALEATVIGDRGDAAGTVSLNKLRSVTGGDYVGGFFGIADVGGVADVGSSSGTNVLSLIQAGNISVLDAFRTYVYGAEVVGVDDGIRIEAVNSPVSMGTMLAFSQSGAAGGFGGALLNGTVETSRVTGLNQVDAPLYSAGFIGYAGRNGGVGVDEVSLSGGGSLLGRVLGVLGLDLSTAAQLLDIVGATVTDCEVVGFDDGFITVAHEWQLPGQTGQEAAMLTGSASAGFVGYADATQIDNCHVSAYKEAVGSQIAAGFVGRTSVAYLADVDVDLTLVQTLLTILKPVIDILYGVTELVPSITIGSVQFSLLSQGNVLYLDMFGFKIGVSLNRSDPELGGSDAITIILGSSTIKVPYDYDSGTIDGDVVRPEASIQLIEGNRTAIKNCSVTGVFGGYDVFAGDSSQDVDGIGTFGYGGGFVGLNDNGYFSHDVMRLCDVVRGTDGLVGPFAGSSVSNTRPLDYLEGNDNSYFIYRSYDTERTKVKTAGGTEFGSASYRSEDDESVGEFWNRYGVMHREVVADHSDLDGATKGDDVLLEAYESGAKARLMDDNPVSVNTIGNTVEPDDMKDPCAERFDISVNKRWEGDVSGIWGTRPDSIVVHVVQMDAGITPPQRLISTGIPDPRSTESKVGVFEVTLDSVTNAQTHTEAWKAKFKNLPVAYKNTSDNSVYYYHYYVSEIQVSDYTTSYEVNQGSASVTITNTYNGDLLPYLGGEGASDDLRVLFLLLASMLLGLVAYRLRRWRLKGARL